MVDKDVQIDASLIHQVVRKLHNSWDYVGELLGNNKLHSWMINNLTAEENYRRILTDAQRERARAIIGPHGDTILKAIEARKHE